MPISTAQMAVVRLGKLLQSTLVLILSSYHFTSASSGINSFHESLTLHPTPDGKLSVLFEFTTYFTSPRLTSRIPQSHFSLTPPSLLLPLERNNVSELTISFVAGQWDQLRSGESGPLHYEAGGGGGEVRGWLRSDGDEQRSAEAWAAVTHALGGLFCAGLGPTEYGENLMSFGEIYPSHRNASGLTHYLLSHPSLHLCTENLTPFLALLPSKGLSGLSSLLAQPGVIFSWGFKSEGIDVSMPAVSSPQGRWRGWWEGVVDLVPERGGSREFSIRTLFRRGLPRAFSEAGSSVLRVIIPEGRSLRMDLDPDNSETRWVDGKRREMLEWDLLDESKVMQDVRFWWDNESHFIYPPTISPPPISISRTVTSRHASDGALTIRIENASDDSRRSIYSEIWPWWVKGWMSEIEVRLVGENGTKRNLLESIGYNPSSPPKISTTTVHFTLTLPPKSILLLVIPFSKLTLKYTEHRPDAERGVEIPSGLLTLLDVEGEKKDPTAVEPRVGEMDPRKSDRNHIYTPRILLDVPTPDFSMPYNVIIMSSTVMAVFFGLMQGGITRRGIRNDISQSISDFRKSNPTFKPPHLLILQLGSNTASTTYIRMKLKAAQESGMTVEHVQVPSDNTGGVKKVLELVRSANDNEAVSGILVQLPLDGAQKDEEKMVVDSVRVEKDVDGFHPENIGFLSSRTSEPLFTPCTPAGVIKLIESTGFKLSGANVVVLGRSDIVGTPVCALLRRRDATVTQCHSRTKDLEEIVGRADLVVAAIGRPEFVRGEWLKKGSIVIDVGTNYLPDSSKKSGQRLVGDVHFESAAAVASYITPVPGGVGPMTVAMLMSNTFDAAKRTWQAARERKVVPLPLELSDKVPSDIEIALAQTPKPVAVIAAELGVRPDEVENYGKYKAKIELSILQRLSSRQDGKYIVVAGITPTPLGEGKSTTTVGLAQALGAHLNKVAIACVRQPSQGPTFGVKGGAAGGGYSQVIPMTEFNLHLTGDIHAVTAANNLLAAAIDARMFHEATQTDKALFSRLCPPKKGSRTFAKPMLARLKKLGIDKTDPGELTDEEAAKFARLDIDPATLTWNRVLDVNDRYLRSITVGQAPTEKGL
ncbi:MAG: tetrahydrofolate synthase, partial [Tremellales sp. Tagirdzhanova-0007]